MVGGIGDRGCHPAPCCDGAVDRLFLDHERQLDLRIAKPIRISLLGVLVLVAGVRLLITRKYPPALFDLILGVNRWVYRVITYVALMRDEYPPFHLDQGQHDQERQPSKVLSTQQNR